MVQASYCMEANDLISQINDEISISLKEADEYLNILKTKQETEETEPSLFAKQK